MDGSGAQAKICHMTDRLVDCSKVYSGKYVHGASGKYMGYALGASALVGEAQRGRMKSNGNGKGQKRERMNRKGQGME